MKKEYDFSKGKRGAIIPSPGKTKITIRIDSDILDWFRAQCHKMGGGNYQTMMNDALRFYINSKDGHGEDMVRRVLREEMAKYSVRKKRTTK
jgi:hypothetical protein